MSKKIALGRGLKSLLQDSPSGETENISKPVSLSNSGMSEILVSEIEVNPFQPRQYFDQTALKELSESIKVHGIIQPLTVRRLGSNNFQLISGERRYQASKLAGLKTVPAYIRQANDQQMLELALIENIQRENLNPIEVALSYQRLLTECNLKQEELGDRVGKNRSTVTNYLRLLKLPPDIQIALRDNILSMGHARAILGVETPDRQIFLFKRIIGEDLSVRKVEELVRQMNNGKTGGQTSPTEKSGNTASREVTQLQSKLSSHFGTKISVTSDGRKGEIKIPFVSVEDLNRILEILKLG
ncbi:MAG: ParB/RepB/Spo0J family partition protein [Cyclobacteriaceae bacterium]